MSIKNLQEEILRLKKKNDVTILAHFYQPLEVQKVADFLGDSLQLAQNAKEKANTNYILFAGVMFMAETASILNPDKHVLIPSPEAGCPLASYLTAEKVKEFKKKYLNSPVVTYINSTAEVKAESDIICTSSNAVNIVQKIKEEYKAESLLFGPDANLADYTEQITKIKLIKMPENGQCIVHSQITPDDIKKMKKEHPKAKVIVHPECIRAVRESADFVGSTTAMYNRVKKSSANEPEFIIGTEKGLLDKLEAEFPEKKFFLATPKLVCYNMKKNTLELTKYVLEHLDDKTFEVKVPVQVAKKALKPIEKMLELSK